MANEEKLGKIIKLQEETTEALEAIKEEMASRNHLFNQLVKIMDGMKKQIDQWIDK